MYSKAVDCSRIWAAFRSRSFGAVTYIAFPLRCKRWSCPTCRKIKAQRIAAAVKSIFDGQQLYLLTLTFKHDRAPSEVWSDVGGCWNRTRTAIQKKYGSFKFVRVVETHVQSPYPHLHIILTVKPSVSWLKSVVEEQGFGYILDIKDITSDGAGLYIQKYLTKPWPREDSEMFRFLANTRVWSASKGIIPPEAASKGWEALAGAHTLEQAMDSIKTDIDFNFDFKGEVIFSPIGDCAVVVSIPVNDQMIEKPPEEPSVAVAKKELAQLDFVSQLFGF